MTAYHIRGSSLYVTGLACKTYSLNVTSLDSKQCWCHCHLNEKKIHLLLQQNLRWTSLWIHLFGLCIANTNKNWCHVVSQCSIKHKAGLLLYLCRQLVHIDTTRVSKGPLRNIPVQTVWLPRGMVSAVVCLAICFSLTSASLRPNTTHSQNLGSTLCNIGYVYF